MDNSGSTESDEEFAEWNKCTLQGSLLNAARAPFAACVRAMSVALPNMQQRKTARKTITWKTVGILCTTFEEHETMST